MEIQWESEEFLKGLYRDGFHSIILTILKMFLSGFYLDFYKKSRTCVWDFTDVYTFSIDS